MCWNFFPDYVVPVRISQILGISWFIGTEITWVIVKEISWFIGTEISWFVDTEISWFVSTGVQPHTVGLLVQRSFVGTEMHLRVQMQILMPSSIPVVILKGQ